MYPAVFAVVIRSRLLISISSSDMFSALGSNCSSNLTKICKTPLATCHWNIQKSTIVEWSWVWYQLLFRARSMLNIICRGNAWPRSDNCWYHAQPHPLIVLSYSKKCRSFQIILKGRHKYSALRHKIILAIWLRLFPVNIVVENSLDWQFKPVFFFISLYSQ